jgi:hypothetical protein
VLVWLKEPDDAGARRRLSDAADSFRAIPGVRQVTVGKAVPSTRPGVDGSFDLGFVMTFDDEAALRAYQDHPTHVRAVREVLSPLVREVKVYDISAQ